MLRWVTGHSGNSWSIGPVSGGASAWSSGAALQRVFRGTVPVYPLCMIAALVAGAREVRGQAERVDSTSSHRQPLGVTGTVVAGTARITVTRFPGRPPVQLRVTTDSGTFTATTDSTVLARWADSAAALPDSATHARGQKGTLKIWQIKADGLPNARITFGRQPSDHGSQLVLVLFNGVWGIIQPLGDKAPAVLAVMHGDLATSEWTDSATVSSPARLADPRNEKQAEQVHGSPEPEYPPELLRAGVEGGATMDFIIDTTGRVNRASVRLVSATDLRFAMACRAALYRMKFQPAQVDGRNVREIVTMPFTFALHKG
jgi:TonB family protein